MSPWHEKDGGPKFGNEKPTNACSLYKGIKYKLLCKFGRTDVYNDNSKQNHNYIGWWSRFNLPC